MRRAHRPGNHPHPHARHDLRVGRADHPEEAHRVAPEQKEEEEEADEPDRQAGAGSAGA